MKPFNLNKSIVLPVLLVILFAGCATSISVMVTKPAEVNMAGARKVALFDFTVPERGRELSLDELWDRALRRSLRRDLRERDRIEEGIAGFATDSLLDILLDTEYFEIISPTDVSRAIEYYDINEVDPIMLGSLLGAEAIIMGDITGMKEDLSNFVRIEKYVDEETETEYEIEVPWVKREVSMLLTYRVINTSTDKLMATRTFNESRFHEVKKDNVNNLRDAEDMYRDILKRVLPQIARQIAPYKAREYRVMMNDQSKPKNPRMKDADVYVKGGVYDKALELYLEIWHGTGNPAAGVNAAILYEVTGNVDEAINVIEQVLEVSAEKKVMQEYNRLKQVREDLKRLEEQMQ